MLTRKYQESYAVPIFASELIQWNPALSNQKKAPTPSIDSHLCTAAFASTLKHFVCNGYSVKPSDSNIQDLSEDSSPIFSAAQPTPPQKIASQLVVTKHKRKQRQR